MLSADKAFVIGSCPACHGVGVARKGRHFFYAVGLICAGILCFFHWLPTPSLFSAIGEVWDRLGLPGWIATAIVWTLTVFPLMFGVAFLWAWVKGDTCPVCNGRKKITRCAPEPNP